MNKIDGQDNPDDSVKTDSRLRFRMLSEAIPQLAWTATPAGKYSYVNQRIIDFCDVPYGDLLGAGWQSLIHPDDVLRAIDAWNSAINIAKPFVIDFRLKRRDGIYVWCFCQAFPMFDEYEKITEWFGTYTDISDRKQAEEEQATTSRLLNEFQKIAKVGGWELDVVTGHLFWTLETYHLHDTSPEEFTPSVDAGVSYFLPESRQIITDALEAAIHHGKGYDLELETLTAKGRKIDVRTTCSVTQEEGKTVKLTGIFQDISDQKSSQRQLESVNKALEDVNAELKSIAHYDALTHLPNRTLLADRLRQSIFQKKRNGRSIAVAFLDLDGFKEVNDTYGHDAGDELLIHIANNMKETLREVDTLARIGGDEFVVLLDDLVNPKECEYLLQGLLETVVKPFFLGTNKVQISASMGVTIYPQDGVDAEQLLRHSDQAMYRAKQSGKNCFHLFDVEQDVAVKTQHAEIENIQAALNNNEFVLFYQPKVNMQTGEVIGAEALIRWQHPQRGLLFPLDFLPVIEDSPLSINIGEWVISTALEQMESWRLAGLDIPVSVNVGALQLQQTNFLKRLENILSQYPNTQPHHLGLEILETSALGDVSQVSTLIDACQSLDIDFALDDFGTGYSSLTYLRRLPATLLKIDQSFVRDMLDDADDLAIIEGIISLASAFGREVIAEGVETVAHGEKLLSLGCKLAQGYGIARPMPAEDIPQWVKSWQPDPVWLRASESEIGGDRYNSMQVQ